jgi:hypothetical protein
MSKGRHRRVHHHVLAAVAVLAVLALVVGVYRAQDDDRSGTAGDRNGPAADVEIDSANGSPGSGSSRPGSSPSPGVIRLSADPRSADSLDSVRLTGAVSGVEPGTTLRVQLEYPERGWVSFPLPTVVDESGRFSTFVELGRRGDNRLRMIDRSSGATSNSVVVEIR